LWSRPLSHHGIDHNRAELLHEIEGQVSTPVAVSMQIADVGVKTDHVIGPMQVVVQQRVAKAEHGIHRISRWTPHATRERERLFDQVPEHAEICRRTLPFMTAEHIQVVALLGSPLGIFQPVDGVCDLWALQLTVGPQQHHSHVRQFAKYALPGNIDLALLVEGRSPLLDA
jgi:hypothetical protein